MIDTSTTGLVEGPELKGLTARAIAHLAASAAVHLSGGLATGKTVLAMHLAASLGRPVILIQGDEQMGRTGLMGRDAGPRRGLDTDHYIHSILRMEESVRPVGEEDRLLAACQHGHTLIYDDFTRSSTEANSILNSVLGEGILHFSSRSRGGPAYVRVHPDFRLILTSNPQEAASSYSHLALLDRLATLRLDTYCLETEIAIVASKSGLPKDEVRNVVDLVRMIRVGGDTGDQPSIRASIAISQILAHMGARACPEDETFLWVCRDVLGDSICRLAQEGEFLPAHVMDEILGRLYIESTDFSAAMA